MTSGVHKWKGAVKYSPEEKKLKDNAELKVKEQLWDQLQIRIEGTAGSKQSAGMDIGNNARIFLHESSRPKVVNMFPENKREAANFILQGLSVIIRIISSNCAVHDMEAYSDHCKAVYSKILREFPYALISYTVHRVLAHSAECMERNGCLGLKFLSEEGLEASNKVARYAQSQLTRKTDPESMLKDIYKPLYIPGIPSIRGKRLVPKCRQCDKSGHTIRSCPVGKFGPLSDDDTLMSSMVVM